MRNSIRSNVKALLDSTWSLTRPRTGNRCIYYHSVHPDTPSSVNPDQFRLQLLWLRDHGYESVLARDVPHLIAKGTDKPKWVCITFDDGYRDNCTIALPILKELGFVATFFVVAGMIGLDSPKSSNLGYRLYKDRPMMTRADLACLVASGMEVGSHTLTHYMATRALKANQVAFAKELDMSKAILEDATGQRVVSFSYPNGQRGAFSPETASAVRNAGFFNAFTTMWGFIDSSSDVWEIPRCEISSKDSRDEFAAKMVGMRDYRAILCKLYDRSRVWNE